MGMGQRLLGGQLGLRLLAHFDLQLRVFQESRHEGAVVSHVHRFANGLKMLPPLEVILQSRQTIGI